MRLTFKYNNKTYNVVLDKENHPRCYFRNRPWYVLKEIDGARICLADPLVYHRELFRHAGWSDFAEWFQALVVKDETIIGVISVDYD